MHEDENIHDSFNNADFLCDFFRVLFQQKVQHRCFPETSCPHIANNAAILRDSFHAHVLTTGILQLFITCHYPLGAFKFV